MLQFVIFTTSCFNSLFLPYSFSICYFYHQLLQFVILPLLLQFVIFTTICFNSLFYHYCFNSLFLPQSASIRYFSDTIKKACSEIWSEWVTFWGIFSVSNFVAKWFLVQYFFLCCSKVIYLPLSGHNTFWYLGKKRSLLQILCHTESSFGRKKL